LAAIAGQPLAKVTSINLRDKGITHVEGLSECVKLRKLDLSSNKVETRDALDGLHQTRSLVHVNLANNRLSDMSIVEDMPQISVFNLSNNQLKSISQSVAKCNDLKALILGQNKISKIEYLDGLQNLNTLVVSQNEISKIPEMRLLKELTKISAAHNKISCIPDLTHHPKLKEVRLNDNRIAEVPENIRRCTSLKVIDLGNNKIDSWSSVAPLASIPYLYNLNLKGNPLCEEAGYREKITKMIPSLRVLDGERFDQWFLDHKEKRRQRMANAVVAGEEQVQRQTGDKTVTETTSKSRKRSVDDQQGHTKRSRAFDNNSRDGNSGNSRTNRGSIRGRGIGSNNSERGSGRRTARGNGRSRGSDRGRASGIGRDTGHMRKK
ncbi:hypothetical protein FB639_003989, partial [Coemansia asiatica]